MVYDLCDARCAGSYNYRSRNPNYALLLQTILEKYKDFLFTFYTRRILHKNDKNRELLCDVKCRLKSA